MEAVSGTETATGVLGVADLPGGQAGGVSTAARGGAGEACIVEVCARKVLGGYVTALREPGDEFRMSSKAMGAHVMEMFEAVTEDTDAVLPGAGEVRALSLDIDARAVLQQGEARICPFPEFRSILPKFLSKICLVSTQISR